MNRPKSAPERWAALIRLTTAQDRQWASLRLWLDGAAAAAAAAAAAPAVPDAKLAAAAKAARRR